MVEKLARTRAKRGGNRSVVTKLSNEANDLLEVEPINKQRLEFIAASLNEKLNLVKTFDEEIIENCAVEEIEAEIKESDEINSRVMDLLRLINEATTPKDNNAGISTVPTTNVSETTSSGLNANETAPSGLESLGVSSNQYGSLLIPVIMSKLPHEIRVQVARNTALEVWDTSELLEVVRQEVEAREISEGVKTNVNLEKVNPKPQRKPTANAHV
ncbi:unnamed protein product [Porites evermanni]|uniref:Uncharacterized protein n=1 Tax=Porites evermanni TaxID=104178 RepID=A0ABN8T4F4_9CNID|nr:unnamed protein product [Porites evermanni]